MIQLNNQFRVPLPVDETWSLLTDLPKVARALPGATLNDIADNEYRGGLSTKIGPISAKYEGTASFRECDEVEHRAVIDARGREPKGSGTAAALVTAVLKADGDGTIVDVSTELTISGRAAQFGRSLLAEVSNSMIEEFVRGLEEMISTGFAEPGESTPEPVAEQPQQAEPQLDVLRAVVLPGLRKVAVPIGSALLAGVIGVLLGRRSRARNETSITPTMCMLPSRSGGEQPSSLCWAPALTTESLS